MEQLGGQTQSNCVGAAFSKKKSDGSIEVDQTEYARAMQIIPITAHRRRRQHEV